MARQHAERQELTDDQLLLRSGLLQREKGTDLFSHEQAYFLVDGAKRADLFSCDKHAFSVTPCLFLDIREYDKDGLITDIDSAGLKTYEYDDAFRITGITDASDAALSQSYGYDLLDRLTTATWHGLEPELDL